ncbi:MAG: penicillin acylase family protein, partial [Deltaproteobacteria bacterium]|nr:penicillin acylase family protein [Deltaproteobacteria bacterium]
MRLLPLIIVLTLFSCGGGGKGAEDTADGFDDDALEAGETMDTGETGEKCFAELDTEKEYTLAGLGAAVKVVKDKWGVPHIYASKKDLFYAEGFVVASDRLIQMHAMRLISSGLFSATPVGSASDLSADVYMRVLDLRGAAEKMWEGIDKNDALLKDILESFAKGVNAYLEAIKSGKVIPPLEYGSLGEFAPWTPVDSLVIGRLQSWDLSFDGQTDEITLMKRLESLNKEFGNTALKGIVQDALHFAPASETTVLPEDTGERGGSLMPPLNPQSDDYFKRFPDGYFARMEKILEPVKEKIRGVTDTPRGSNNWVVSGGLTSSGAPMLANDTHLSLRNPPVFYQIHLNTRDSGGDIDLAGVCFPGIPGIILGHNAYFAWGGTVYYADVTDVYIETMKEGDPPTVLFNNNQVEIAIRKEEFIYNKPGDGCDSYLNDFIKGLKYELKEEGGKCVLTVYVEVVPHHGPIIPGSKVDSGTGAITALSWRWTGFEPSNDLKAVAGLMFGKDYNDFFTALKDFGVGAQNWVYAGTDGHIAYTTFCRLPVRGHLKNEPVLYPPYLPMPGDGCCEWTGDLPFEKFPQALDPKDGK